MKPRDKERLIRMRSILSNDLQVNEVINHMKEKRALTDAEVGKLSSEHRRQTKTEMLLDILERKKTSEFEVFLEILSSLHPNLFYLFTDDDDDTDFGDKVYGEDNQYKGFSKDDEWTILRNTRQYIIEQIDALQVLPMLQKKFLTESEKEDIIAGQSAGERTEALLDILVAKEPAVYDAFLDALGEQYPHVYLRLTGGSDDLDD
ncbi:DgyrCDS6558 [Dimorphilus gyrociliatus]|uniref:DgyrCDS6558 n=1 Tax=Dimorphilus gyrociliatus TaxID=2664684 RepID=A0A7I8VP16_9ANNE|nr:DgyrCDS6558 [Dimorphilus gyrociliatus]